MQTEKARMRMAIITGTMEKKTRKPMDDTGTNVFVLLRADLLHLLMDFRESRAGSARSEQESVQ